MQTTESVKPAQYKMPKELTPTIQMDFAALDDLKEKMTDSPYVEFIWHKVFGDRNAVFKNIENHRTWNFPECWRSRYWLNYIKHKDLLKDANILEIGSLFHFYSVWSIMAGAKSVHGLEPHKERHEISKEYVKIRQMTDQIKSENTSIEKFIKNYDGQKYDVVFFQAVMYYLHNPIEVLHFITHTIRPKYLFLETSVAEDVGDNGHFVLHKDNSTATEEFQVWENIEINLSLTPSRNALRKMINTYDWKIITYYNYKDFIGHGEDPPRKAGRIDYYVLERKDDENSF